MNRVALLRAVNVGGHNQIAMPALCAAFESLLEAGTEKRFGFRVDYMVRTAKEWSEIIARNPLPGPARANPGRFHVHFLKTAPRDGAERALRAAIKGPEEVCVGERHAYIVYPLGAGRSKVTPALLERELGGRGTSRNWNTVLKLAALLV
ncbi:MAG: DUF1697 domain-containing protein [Elusimicrobiota bacterium]